MLAMPAGLGWALEGSSTLAPPAAAQGLTEADRSSTAVKVINTTEILKQHKPRY